MTNGSKAQCVLKRKEEISTEANEILDTFLACIEKSKKQKNDVKMALIFWLKLTCPKLKDRMYAKVVELHEEGKLNTLYAPSSISSYLSETFRQQVSILAKNLDNVLMIVATEFVTEFIEHNRRFRENFENIRPAVDTFQQKEIARSPQTKKFVRRTAEQIAAEKAKEVSV